MRQNLLLLEDVDDLGKSGEIVQVRPGFARNFLLPKKKAIFADKQTLKMQKRLQEERAKKAALDLKDAQEQAKRIEGLVLTTHVKVDPEGRMYGSVSQNDIVMMLEAEGISIEKRNVALKHHLKEIGVSQVPLKLKEEVTCSFQLKVLPEGVNELEEILPPVVEAAPEAKKPEEETSPESQEQEATKPEEG